MSRLLQVNGVVLDADGSGVAECSVGATSRTPGVSVLEIAAITGADGSWGLPVYPDALYDFTAFCHDTESTVRSGNTQVMVRSGHDAVIEIALPEPGSQAGQPSLAGA